MIGVDWSIVRGTPRRTSVVVDTFPSLGSNSPARGSTMTEPQPDESQDARRHEEDIKHHPHERDSEEDEG